MQPLERERVLYEDADILVVNKPPGLPIHPTLDQNRDNLWGRARAYLGGAYLGLHHRLDRDCSGAVMFTKTERANPGMAKAFQSRAIDKRYVCIVQDLHPLKRPLSGTPTEFELRLKKVKVRGISRMQVVAKGGDSALTWLSREGPLVRASLVTGRMHQIRVTLSWLGCPIVGDPLYGAKVPLARRLMLHAEHLAFDHPITGVKVAVDAPWPEDFKAALAQLQKKG